MTLVLHALHELSAQFLSLIRMNEEFVRQSYKNNDSVGAEKQLGGCI